MNGLEKRDIAWIGSENEMNQVCGIYRVYLFYSLNLTQ